MSRIDPYLRGLFFLLIFTLLLGIIYPLLILGIGAAGFSAGSHGSRFVSADGTILGSELIGMDFTSPDYFSGRPSATTGGAYHAEASGGSNYGLTAPPLREEIRNRTAQWRNFGLSGDIPSDLVMASGSGLDPHISIEAALLQVPLVAKARNISPLVLESLVRDQTLHDPFAGEYVRVLSLNIALDQVAPRM